MLIRYAYCIEKMEIDDTFHALKALVTQKRNEKIERYRFDADKLRSLYAEILLRYTLKKHFGLEGKSIDIEINEYGKPSLKEHKEIQFNLSHSGNWVLCAVSDKAVGVDVEEIKDKNLDIAKRFFAPCEYERLKASDKKSQLFMAYWTLKESYVKAEGKGMSIPFDTFSFTLTEREACEGKDSDYEIALQVNRNPCDTYQFQTYQIVEDMMVSTCSQETIEGRFENVKQEELIKILLG